MYACHSIAFAFLSALLATTLTSISAQPQQCNICATSFSPDSLDVFSGLLCKDVFIKENLDEKFQGLDCSNIQEVVNTAGCCKKIFNTNEGMLESQRNLQLFPGIQNGVTTMIEGAQSGIEGAVNGASGVVESVNSGGITDLVVNAQDAVDNLMNVTAGALRGVGTNVGKAVGDTFSNLNGVASTITNATGGVIENLPIINSVDLPTMDSLNIPSVSVPDMSPFFANIISGIPCVPFLGNCN